MVDLLYRNTDLVLQCEGWLRSKGWSFLLHGGAIACFKKTARLMRATLIARGLARAQTFSWDTCARTALNAYQDLVGPCV